MNFYDKHPGYKVLKKEIINRYGSDKQKKIWQKAGDALEALCKEYADISECEKWHTDNNIFPRIAMYRVLQVELPDDAMILLDGTVERVGKRVDKILRTITAIPGMDRVFLRVMERMEKTTFGPSAGFKHEFYPTEKTELRFDIIECPYCKYCEKNGCPELAHTFCDSDVYCYGNLPKIAFKRTQTLGTGGERCDFYISIKGGNANV